MKKALLFLFLLTGLGAAAQSYYNEWIDYSKTYYKFKVGATGVWRVPQTTLASAGLGSIPADQFQLWRNGRQVPLYTSVPTGTLGASDYIEFWGEMNDGLPDTLLYREREYQLASRWSLETDTAAYFLTVNTGANMRLTTIANNVTGTALTPLPYFMYNAGYYLKVQQFPGYAVNVGDYMYSASYDRAEGWTSANVAAAGTSTYQYTGLFPYTGAGAPQAKFLAAVSGNATNQRGYKITINNDSTIGGPLNYFNELTDSTYFSVSRISTGTANVVLTNTGTAASDRMVIHRYELTYPRLFNFGGASSFEFTLPASATGQYIQITNVAGTAPVLYDLSNGLRLVANTDVSGQFRFVLPPSAGDRRMVLIGSAPVNTVAGLQQRTFTDLSQSANQGDFLIISNPLLTAGANGTNPIEDYRAYRNTAAGGNYNAKIFWSDDLIDQFGFGIKGHPLGIANFIRYARNRFGTAPKGVFIIGKGVTYNQAKTYETNVNLPRLHLVPTFGQPASDNLLAADPGSSQPKTPIGRLAAIWPYEVANYLAKVKQFEQAQAFHSPMITDKAWMKNVVHLAGSSEPTLLGTLAAYLSELKGIAADTLFGAHVTTFIKDDPNTVVQINNGELDRLFAEGISLITYFGHSASSHLEYNLNNPSSYNNPGKYPLFVALGCNVGNVYNFNTTRLNTLETISEQYTLAPERGSIGFIASSHFGITDYLQNLSRPFYDNFSRKHYGATIGELMNYAVADMFAIHTEGDFYARATAEESNLDGDPVIRLNPMEKPDYAIEDAYVRVNPGFVSVADGSFRLTASAVNLGRAVNRNIVVEVKRQFPNGTTQIVARDTIPGIRFIDSVAMNIQIDPVRDKGLNRITVTVDADNAVDELYETNNSITKDVFIYEDEARPVYPYNYAIVNHQNIRFVASTANPFTSSRNYRFELDTTQAFNSSQKVTSSVTSAGGVLEFTPAVTLSNNTVYYWRVAEAVTTGTPNWSNSSFLYLAATDSGFNQSHYFQYRANTYNRMYIDSASRQFKYANVEHELYVRNGVWGTSTGQEGDLVVNVDGQSYIRNTCNYGFILNVFDGNTFRPIINSPMNTQGRWGSLFVCGSPKRQYNFEYLNSAAGRKAALTVLDSAKVGDFIVVRNQPLSTQTGQQYAADWAADPTFNGRTFYQDLKNAGFTLIDSIYKPRVFGFVFKKGSGVNGVPAFTPVQGMSVDKFDVMSFSAYCPAADSLGSMVSPLFGPAAAWKTLQWDGYSLESPRTDSVRLNLLGIRSNGAVDTLIRGIRTTQNNVDISNISASVYPYLKMHMRTADTSKLTPYQLNYWRLLYSPKAEGAVAPNLLFNMKDSFEAGEPIEFKMAFKNVSDVPFDSLLVKAVITDQSNVAHPITLGRFKPLVAGDTLSVRFPLDTRALIGNNTLFVDVNPDGDQPELYHFNNFIYKNFVVTGDSLNPLLDVTFDSRHILNGDIVASSPTIDIRLKDEAKYRLLDDTSLVSVQVIDPAGVARGYAFGTDTLRFEPATTGANNQATVHFRPSFAEDGTYQLVVTGKDKSGNAAGKMEYKVAFEVINKPMISNMLNYPNPFTTSTAFVFTITGSQVPQNIRIQILTITGKVVREITKEELGPLHVGANITEYKWDGTDQYGQKLGNGVYLYRVITNLNGQSLDKYTNKGEKTDKYFNKGYGKMYLMR